jgi:predicted DNA-binding transcriptional regulator YafY
VRTARRYLSDLEANGKAEAYRDGLRKRYRLRDEYQTTGARAVAFTSAEAEALTVAMQAARALLAPTPLAEPLQSAAGKLDDAWLSEAFAFDAHDEPRHWHFADASGGSASPFDPDCFAALLRAVRDTRPVRVAYYTASRDALGEDRLLHPLGFHVRSGAWMLAAFDPQPAPRGRFVKDFALSGFHAVDLDERATFDPPRGFDLHEYARARFRALAGDATHEVRLEVSAEVLPYFRRKSYHPTQQIEAVHADGSATVSFKAEGLRDMTAWALSWGPKLRVTAPPELVERVAKAHREAATLYAGGKPFRPDRHQAR